MRRLFRLAVVLLLAGTTVSGQERQIQTILFICEHGSAKSVIAAAHFNRLAEQKGLAYRAVARGTNPDPEIHQQIRFNLAKDERMFRRGSRSSSPRKTFGKPRES